MKKIFLLFLFLLNGFFTVTAEMLCDSLTNDSVVTVDRKKLSHKITFSSEYFFGSDALTADLAATYFRNGFISEEMKDVVSEKLKSSNIFGAGFNYEINYRRTADTLFGLANSYYQIGFRDVYHLDARFSKDVFELYFRGNKNYAGKSAELSNFEFRQLFYQQLYFAFGHTFTRTAGQFEFAAGLNFNKGHQMLTIKANEASLFTQQNGEFLDLNADLELHRNDSSKNDRLAANGIGGSVDLYFKWTDKKKRSLEFTAQNFGMIAWNDRSSVIKADTAFRFEGVDISELFDFTDSVSNSLSLDSSFVQPYLTKRSKESYTTLLPALLKVGYNFTLEKIKTEISTEAGYLLFANCKPFIRQSYKYMFNSNHSAGLSVGYGGYSNFNAGLFYELSFKNLELKLKSDNVTGYFMKNSTSQGAFVSLAKKF